MSFIKFDPAEDFYFHNGMSKRVAETGTSWPHYHSLYEIYFMLEGNCTYIIDNKVYSVQAGDIVVIPDGMIHHTKYDNIKHSRILINCSKKYIPSSVQSGFSSGTYLYRNPFVVDEARKLFEKTESEYKLGDAYSDEILVCLTHSLFYLLLRNSDSCVTDITLSSLAKRFSVSPEHFSRMFKKETGLGFSKYLNSLRLQYAEHLLRSSDMQNITQIAEICGFEDSNYFSKKFKEVYGVSPKKVQRKIFNEQ